jgi:hypothetical protein
MMYASALELVEFAGNCVDKGRHESVGANAHNVTSAQAFDYSCFCSIVVFKFAGMAYQLTSGSIWISRCLRGFYLSRVLPGLTRMPRCRQVQGRG